MLWWKSAAEVYQAEQSVNATAVTQANRVSDFRKCAEAFSACADNAPTTEDFQVLMTSSARCFVQAKDHKAAAKAFRLATRFNDAAWHYRQAECFDEALDIIHSFPSKVEETLADSITEVAKLVYTRKREVQYVARPSVYYCLRQLLQQSQQALFKQCEGAPGVSGGPRVHGAAS